MHARTFAFKVLLLLTAGCAAPPVAPAFGPDDPVSTSAIEAPLPPISNTLAIDGGSAAESPAPTHDHDHDGHGGRQ